MVEPKLPKVECIESSDTYGRFMAEPLEVGVGLTLGNALRRVLLSSLTGAAVNWVRIEGVEHEFSTLPYMKEDTVEFLLNVKALRLRPIQGQPGKLRLEVEGEGQVCAADIIPCAEFEIMNPELHLAALDSPQAKLFVEFNVELGKGYVPASHSNGLPIGVIPVDAVFSPVRKVNYAVNPAHISRETSYEQLELEVWTDGTISPEGAVSQSAAVLMEQFSMFTLLAEEAREEEEEKALPFNISLEQYNMPLTQLNLSTRTLNSLKRHDITTMGKLLETSQKELLSLRNFGQRSKEEVQECLTSLGLTATPAAEEEHETSNSWTQTE
ncbi:DNA-directed RNA polymerase subunit alpha [Chloroflexota bacterium]